MSTSRPIRVCFLIDELARAGTETQLLALIRGLDRSRIEPTLCLLRGDSPTSRALEPCDCPVHRLGMGSLHSPRTWLRTWRFARFLRRESFDVLQVYFPDSTYVGVPAAWLAGTPAVVRTRNNLGHWLTPLHRRLGRFLNRFTTATIVNSEAARDALFAAENPTPESVVVLENGVDLERFAHIAPLEERPPGLRNVGIVANLRPVKGLDVFLHAAEQIAKQHPETQFSIAGDGEQRDELEQLTSRLGLTERVRFHGAVSDIPGFLDRLDVAVLSSHAEGMSNALLEYMAAGRAIVATAVGAATRMIDAGVHGMLVPPGDAGQLAVAVASLLADPCRAWQLGAAACRRAEAEFSRAAMVRRFEEFYEQSVEARHPRAALASGVA
jgi:glycosyltransferase involved in cell wall biosynthesis